MAPTKEKHGLHFKAGFFLGIFCLLFLALSPTVNAKEPLTGYSSKEIVEQMGIGWNLGNTLDATGGNAADVFSQEQSWGNPIVTGELIDAVGEAGFTTIRIPVTWYRHLSDDGTYTIDADFLERVKTVVDYAYENDMFIILNIHHEEWLNTSGLATDYEQMGEELSAIWTQLADYFADYDQHLIFEGMNEPRMAGTNVEWGGNDAGYAAVNYLNQVFVSTVRNSNKGYNQERCLMIPGYAASGSSNVLESIVIPTVNGEAVNNLIISVHCYSPYNFCLSDAMTGFDPTSSECVSEIDGLFDTLQKLFLDNGIPVVIGETSATNKNNTEAREKWAYYMANKSAAYGVPIVIWDNGANGSSGGECHAYINRATCEWNFPTVIKSLMDGLNSIEWGSGRIEREEATESENSSLLGGSVIWSDENGLTSTALWDYTYIAMGSKESYYLPGREIAVVYSGNGEPKVILDSSEMNVWWIPIDPDRIETLDDKKVAYFGYDTIIKSIQDAGVEKTSQLRNLSLLAANDNITTYEICLTGDAFVVTYLANGTNYYIGTDMPEDPSFTNMEFAGWYTTKNYLPGTEYTGGDLTGDTVVYAKFNFVKKEISAEEEINTSEKEEIAADIAAAETEPVETKSEETKPGETEVKETTPPEAESNDGSLTSLWILITIVIVLAVIAIVFITSKKRAKHNAP